MNCPACNSLLSKANLGDGMGYTCGACSGVWMNLAIVRRSISHKKASSFWKQAQTHGVPSSRKCSSCSRAMIGFSVEMDTGTVHLDLCEGCQAIWFDAGELAACQSARITLEAKTAPPPAQAKMASTHSSSDTALDIVDPIATEATYELAEWVFELIVDAIDF